MQEPKYTTLAQTRLNHLHFPQCWSSCCHFSSLSQLIYGAVAAQTHWINASNILPKISTSRLNYSDTLAFFSAKGPDPCWVPISVHFTRKAYYLSDFKPVGQRITQDQVYPVKEIQRYCCRAASFWVRVSNITSFNVPSQSRTERDGSCIWCTGHRVAVDLPPMT